MPGGSGKPVRSCKICKPNKFLGNAKGYRKAKEEARAPGQTKSERRRQAWSELD
jgi:hypothetical protein